MLYSNIHSTNSIVLHGWGLHVLSIYWATCSELKQPTVPLSSSHCRFCLQSPVKAVQDVDHGRLNHRVLHDLASVVFGPATVRKHIRVGVQHYVLSTMGGGPSPVVPPGQPESTRRSCYSYYAGTAHDYPETSDNDRYVCTALYRLLMFIDCVHVVMGPRCQIDPLTAWWEAPKSPLLKALTEVSHRHV